MAVESNQTSNERLQDPALFRDKCYINGEWVQAVDSRRVDVFNPATGEVIGTIPNAAEEEVHRAIAAASEAGAHWRARTAKERATVLRRWHDLILQHQEDLALLIPRNS